VVASSQFRISTWVPSASHQWVKSACQRSLGCSAAKRMKEDVGRRWGVGAMRPVAARWRWMLGADTTKPWWNCKCQAMVWGPWSSPLPDSSRRRPMIRSMVACGSQAGLLCGRRERGWNAASPSSRYRATNFEIQP
jgi:hypothetical protein